MKLPLTTQHLVLNGILHGSLSVENASPTDFDKDELLVFTAAQSLFAHGSAPPLCEATLCDQIRHAQGKDPVPETVKLVLKHIEESPVNGDAEGLRRSILEWRGAKAILKGVTSFLSSGKPTLPELAEELSVVGRGASPRGIKVSQYLDAQESDHGHILRCVSLPQLMRLTGDVRGIWVVAGAPGFGKSTLIMQMMLDLAYQGTYVYWFNFELDPRAIHDRLIAGWNESVGTPEQLRQATENIEAFTRKQVGQIKDLAAAHATDHPEQPAMFVVDTFQKLPVKTNFTRSSYDQWLHTFEEINMEYGYPFLLASQKDRKSYEEATLWGFKETSELESTMTVGLQILPIEGIFGALEMYIVKNRHAKYTGHCLNLFRETDFWFREEVII